YPNLDNQVSCTKSNKKPVMRGICPVNKTTPIIIITTPPTFIIIPLFWTIHLVEPIKKVNKINGKANPMTYITVYIIPCVGLLAASNKIEPNIGPIQGVQPAAKPKPTKNVPT